MEGPKGAGRCSRVAGKLPTVHGDDAAASRVAFNARFQRWLSGLFPEQRLHYVTKGTRSRALLIEVEIMSCRARLALDPADWPVLYMALSMPDEDVACAVASELILRLSAALQGSGMPIRVCSRWLPGA